MKYNLLVGILVEQLFTVIIGKPINNFMYIALQPCHDWRFFPA